jgi:hypothetical protein
LSVDSLVVRQKERRTFKQDDEHESGEEAETEEEEPLSYRFLVHKLRIVLAAHALGRQSNTIHHE